MKRGGPLRRTTPLARSGIARMSAKRRAKLLVYRQECAAVDRRSGGRCEARTDVCTGRGEHHHHVHPRARGGVDDRENLLHVCRACHDWIHANGRAAKAAGLLRSKP